MPAYVLVEVDGNPILVKTDVEDLQELHVKYSYCHKRFTAETCVVVTSYSDEEFSERIPVGRFTVECDGKVVKDDLEEIMREFKDEILEILVRYYFDDVKQAVEDEERRAKRKNTARG